MPARGSRLGAALLPEHVVGELPAPVFVHAAAAERGQVEERLTGELANTRLRQIEHLGELLIVLATPEHELDDGALLLGELVKGSHGGRTIGCAG